MKNFKTTISLTVMLLFAAIASAQTAKSKNINGQLIDPATNCVLRYYYFPNLEAYYDTQKNIYYYLEGTEWKIVDEIPAGYRGYSLYNKVNVIINDYDDDNPTTMHLKHKKKYPYITKDTMKKMAAVTE